MFNHVTLIGIIAGLLTATSMLPQLIKIIKTKKVEDVSISMLIVLLSGVGTWVYYGILKEDWPIIATNALSCLICMITLFYKIRYRS